MGRLQGDIMERTLRFGIRALDAMSTIPNEPRGWVVSKQFGKAATSIGANVWEADGAISEAEFASKISIARKEALEATYWLALMRETMLMPDAICRELHAEAIELASILAAIVKKTQAHIRAHDPE